MQGRRPLYSCKRTNPSCSSACVVTVQRKLILTICQDQKMRLCIMESPFSSQERLAKILNTKVRTPSFYYDHSHYQLLICIELDQLFSVELTEHGYTHTEKGFPSTFMPIQGILEFTKPDSALVFT
ncbi:hypothetical protein VNO77_22838 [Canavalia gladiata]|uniref:Uncharacterized protein n=1 Tax=Canavalia gladiata TaxID=3824 RepID=A0AAN9L4T1_CANGL